MHGEPRSPNLGARITVASLPSVVYAYLAVTCYLKMFLDWLQQADFTKGTTQCIVIFGSLCVYTSIYLTSMVVSPRFATYRDMSTREKVFWNLIIVRAVFGAYSAITCSYCLLVEDELHTDIVLATTRVSHVIVCSGVGFFMFECLAFFTSAAMFGKMDRSLAAHHTIALLSYGRCCYVQMPYFYACIGLVLEMTTPFTCVCWILLKAKLMNSKLWVINQWILVHLFHCRSFIECYVWYTLWKYWDHVSSTLPVDVLFLQVGSLAILSFILTPYWTYKKTNQLFERRDWNHPELTSKTD